MWLNIASQRNKMALKLLNTTKKSRNKEIKISEQIVIIFRRVDLTNAL